VTRKLARRSSERPPCCLHARKLISVRRQGALQMADTNQRLGDCSAALRALTMADKLQLTDAQPQATSPKV